MSVWFVTGASRGLGAAIAREALSRGHQVAATARDADAVRRAFPDSPDVLALAVDVTDERQINAAVEATVERFGRIDVLVNNAGRGQVGAVEEVSDAAARALFELNVFGVLNVLRAVLPTIREQRSGHVINIGSVGGFATAPGSVSTGRRSSPWRGYRRHCAASWRRWASTSPSSNRAASAPISSTARACRSSRT